jgi:hypothetical protein
MKKQKMPMKKMPKMPMKKMMHSENEMGGMMKKMPVGKKQKGKRKNK